MVRFHRREWLRLRPMQQDVLFYLAMFRYKTVFFVMKRNEQIKSLMDYFNFIRDQNAAKMIRIFKFRLHLGIIDRSREDLSQIGWPDVISDRPGRAWAHRSPSNRSTFCWWYVQRRPIQRYLAATKQLWLVQVVRPSVRLSVIPFSLCSHHRIIIELLPLTKVMPMQKAKVRGQMSMLQRSEQILPQFGIFRPIAPVWITDGYEVMHIAWNSIEEVPYRFFRSPVKFHAQSLM